MASLLALDFPLGPDLETALRRCVDAGQAFCVLDQRVSPARRAEELHALGASRVVDAQLMSNLDTGLDVDDEIGLVMLTSGSSPDPRELARRIAARLVPLSAGQPHRGTSRVAAGDLRRRPTALG